LPYPVYVFSGTILWAIFTDAFNAPLNVAIAAKSMLSKVNFPREALVLSGVLQTLFNSGIKVLILLIAMTIMGFTPTWLILLFPFALISLLIAGTTLGLLMTPLGLLYSDIGKSIPLVMQFMMYLTPVVFPMPEKGIAATLFRLNPLTPLIMTARNWLTGFSTEFLPGFLLVTLIMLLLLFLVWIIYKLTLPILIERMNA
jgi:lipopolysaccharide transport system permease protein